MTYLSGSNILCSCIPLHKISPHFNFILYFNFHSYFFQLFLIPPLLLYFRNARHLFFLIHLPSTICYKPLSFLNHNLLLTCHSDLPFPLISDFFLPSHLPSIHPSFLTSFKLPSFPPVCLPPFLPSYLPTYLITFFFCFLPS